MLVSRMCGGGWTKLPRWLRQALYATPFSIITYVLLPNAGAITYMLCLLAGATAFAGKSLGNGRGISIGEPMKPGSTPERVEILILWLQPHIPNWLYKCLILLLDEAVVWVGIAVAVSPWLMFGAFVRPIAYLIGWGIWIYAENNGYIRRTQTLEKSVKYISFMPDYIGVHTAIGEFLTGFFSGIILYQIVYFMWIPPMV